MYCGDGINDLIALSAADVGMTVGSSEASAAATISNRNSSIAGDHHAKGDHSGSDGVSDTSSSKCNSSCAGSGPAGNENGPAGSGPAYCGSDGNGQGSGQGLTWVLEFVTYTQACSHCVAGVEAVLREARAAQVIKLSLIKVPP